MKDLRKSYRQTERLRGGNVFFVACLLTGIWTAPGILGQDAPFLTPLRARGFSLIPSPQRVDLGERNIIIDGSWAVVTDTGEDDIAFKRLTEGSAELHGLLFARKGKKKILLSVMPGTVKGSDDPAINEQGYLFKVTPSSVEITGNSSTGLFYGIQSFLQLLHRDHTGSLVLPECVIQDWPSLQLRFVHWDTKHHQKRPETMKRLIDWHAFFKVNMIALEIEDKYE